MAPTARSTKSRRLRLSEILTRGEGCFATRSTWCCARRRRRQRLHQCGLGLAARRDLGAGRFLDLLAAGEHLPAPCGARVAAVVRAGRASSTSRCRVGDADDRGRLRPRGQRHPGQAGAATRPVVHARRRWGSSRTFTREISEHSTPDIEMLDPRPRCRTTPRLILDGVLVSTRGSGRQQRRPGSAQRRHGSDGNGGRRLYGACRRHQGAARGRADHRQRQPAARRCG